MGFSPQIPLAGIAGWRFLQRTQATQEAAFAKGAELQREIAYFRENIGSVTSAEELVADRRLLKVALGAFGLEGEIDKKAFIRKVLEGGTEDPEALASRLTAPGFKEIADAFGFGNAAGARTGTAGFADGIVAAYKSRAFEAAVGEKDNDMRLAMNLRREIAALAAGEGGSWYKVIGSSPLREVFEKAYGLPSSFGQLDVDKQRDVLRDKTSALFGTSGLTAFAKEENVEKLVTRFLVRAQIDAGPSATAPGAAALTLLQGSRGSSSGLLNLISALG
ncbi:DUF1217 domain-containing protein [Amaricoccus sp.]|uniref:DUF1217 domain-containing protein n=1 Tax=Amaricoccus sp. TaxID=1872485 RepID=UPI001B40BEE1|nr:DUF1217 domain-containing protein [Amaricoccus sp.]MBP7001949.1 DUF1217 domain-containing protein [Amaricoccus sp.]